LNTRSSNQKIDLELKRYRPTFVKELWDDLSRSEHCELFLQAVNTVPSRTEHCKLFLRAINTVSKRSKVVSSVTCVLLSEFEVKKFYVWSRKSFRINHHTTCYERLSEKHASGPFFLMIQRITEIKVVKNFKSRNNQNYSIRL
jgi:hypothetical protein